MDASSILEKFELLYLGHFDVPGSVAGPTQGNPDAGTWKLTVGRADYLPRIVAFRHELFIYDNIATDRLKPGAR